MYKRILVPLDGSDTSRLGLREALALAKDHKATVRLLHVISEVPTLTELAAIPDFESVQRRLLQRAEAILEDARALAASLGIDAETATRELAAGRVSDAIVDEARDAGCDLIAIGTHGRRGVSRALLGSDAERVLRQATVPVLLVREQASRS